MSLFSKENANNIVLKGLVSESKYPDYAGGEKSFSLSSVANQVVNKVLEGYNGEKVNYINGNPFKAEPTNNNAGQPTKTSVPSSDGGWAIDIAQSHHFTVEIRDASCHKSSSGNLLSYKTPNNVYSSFLPVKNMSLSYSGYENLNIPLSIFGDFQLLQRKRVETITLTCYDEDTSFLERNLQTWNEECFPQGKYVAYMDDVVKELIYRGYTVDGRESLNVRRFVIPTGQVMVNRDYSENEAKFITFSLACVGDGSVCATGSPSVLVDMPIDSSGGTVNESAVNEGAVNDFISANAGSNGQFIGNDSSNSNPVGPTKPKSTPKSVSPKVSVATKAVANSALTGNPIARLGTALAVEGMKIVAKFDASKLYPHYK